MTALFRRGQRGLYAAEVYWPRLGIRVRSELMRMFSCAGPPLAFVGAG